MPSFAVLYPAARCCVLHVVCCMWQTGQLLAIPSVVALGCKFSGESIADALAPLDRRAAGWGCACGMAVSALIIVSSWLLRVL